MFYPTKYAQNKIVRPFGLLIQEQMEEIGSLISDIANQGERIPLSMANKVSLMSLFKLRETVNSILLLTLNGCIRDAGVLLLTLIELKLDLQYIGCSETRAERWIKHDKLEGKPWKVKNLIKELYPNLSEQDAYIEIYRYYSAIKHVNPAAGTQSLPFGVSDGWLSFSDKQNIPNFIAVTLFGTGMEMVGIFESATNTFLANGFKLKSFQESLLTKNDVLKKLNSKYIRQMLITLLKRDTF